MAFKRSAVRSRLAPPLFKRPPFGAAFWFLGCIQSVFDPYSIRIFIVCTVVRGCPFSTGGKGHLAWGVRVEILSGCMQCSSAPKSQNRLQPAQGILQRRIPRICDKGRFAFHPVDASRLVRQDHAFHRPARWQHHLERSSPHPAGDRADKGQTRPRVEGER